MMRKKWLISLSVVLLAACSSTSHTPTSTTTSTTTTQPPPPPAALLTGLPQPNEDLRKRPVLTVKIDNHPQARPQFGIDKADVIVEERVEGGLSRFMALFQSEDSDKVGPVRSLRSTDPAWLRPEGGMIAYSGGIDPVKALLGPAGIVDLGADNHGSKYYKRRSDRPFEHSMYVSTPVLRELTPDKAAAPEPLFSFLGPNEHFSGGGSVPVASISISMGSGVASTAFDWTWDGSVFRRGTDSKPHEIEGAGQIGMQNVIVQFVDYRSTPWRDRANSPVDEAVSTGSGEAWILSGGQLVKGHWSRPTATDITQFTDAAGATVKLQPGHTWLTLAPKGERAEIR